MVYHLCKIIYVMNQYRNIIFLNVGDLTLKKGNIFAELPLLLYD